MRGPRRRRSQIGRRRRIPVVTAALAVGYVAAAAYGVSALRSFTRVEVTVDGLTDSAVLTSSALAGQSVWFRPSKNVDRSTLQLDGVAVPDKGTRWHATGLEWRPDRLAEGRHEIVLSVPRPGMGDARFHRRFTIDDTPRPSASRRSFRPPASVNR